MMNLQSKPYNANAIAGISIALSLLSLWILSLVLLLFVDTSRIAIWEVAVAVFVRTFLHTGLFITAHDAMHRAVFPQRQVNDLIGAISTIFYALLSYQALAKKHRLHHRYPASGDDPDFFERQIDSQPENQPSLWLWYFKFMQGYLYGKQLWIVLIGIALIFSILNLGCHIAASNLLLFWILPMLGSSVQLFYFGTFLPHRRLEKGYEDRHRARSTNCNRFWSFVACYHFGYHWEHHENPHLPWYKLPSARWDVLGSQIERRAIKVGG
jgi:beta-carotene/zeaxanthin 4-ketolase